mgnify:CR=1 FL=1
MDGLFAYSAEVLAFAGPDALPPAPDAASLERHVQRALRLVQAAGKDHLVLLGLGSGTLAAALARDLPAGVRLLACTLRPESAAGLRQAGALAWWTPESPHALVADTSPWALLCLLDMAGARAETACLLLNPEAAEPERSRLAALQRTLAAAKPLAVAALEPAQAPSLSAAAILSPDEPDLDLFFAQFPGWLAELAVLWDAEQVPQRTFACAPPLRQAARPLAGDFAAQRNAMLGRCQGDWVFYLDADETLAPADWDRILGLCGQKSAAGWHFPRLTFFPDQDHCRMGLGLWPDLQLRLFRRSAGLCFINPVHERLTGLDGPEALALDLALLHHTHLRKRPEAIRAKLAVFDQAGGLRHNLSKDYPHLPRPLLEPTPQGLAVRGLLLPSS